jgi:Zn-dependent alcohol dehydrogenase
MKRYRKAIVAGVGSAVTTAAGAIVAAGPEYNNAEIAIIVLSAVGAGVAVGLSTYEVRNEGPGIGPTGSETQPMTGGAHRIRR